MAHLSHGVQRRVERKEGSMTTALFAERAVVIVLALVVAHSLLYVNIKTNNSEGVPAIIATFLSFFGMALFFAYAAFATWHLGGMVF